MAMLKEDLAVWLDTLPSDAVVFIEEGGLTLACLKDPSRWVEIGGEPEEDE